MATNKTVKHVTGNERFTQRQKHQPFKHKIRYAKAVTVCVAVACLEDNRPRIALCSDTRLDYEYFGSTNFTCKLDMLGYGWCIQMAGHWSGAKELCRILRGKVQELADFPSLSEMALTCRAACSELLLSPLYRIQEDVQVLLSGFDGLEPSILTVSVIGGEITVESSQDFSAIGSGGTIALTILRLRECNPQVSFSHGVYFAYEAKRTSEKCGTVGRFTTLVVQAPPVRKDRDKAWIIALSDQGESNLESLYQTLWKTPFGKLPELSQDSFIELGEKQAPE